MQSIARPRKTKSPRFRCGSPMRQFHPAQNRTMNHRHLKRGLSLLVLLICLAGCVNDGPSEPTPEAAKQFLQLRGYEFDQPAFFRAAEAGDAIAVNGFLTAGMNVNTKDKNDDTALTAAADRGDLQIVNVLL